MKTKTRATRRSPARTGSAMIAEMVYECRRVQRMVFDVCMDSRSPKLLGTALNDLAKLESSMDRVHDLIHRKLPKLPKSPNAPASATPNTEDRHGS